MKKKYNILAPNTIIGMLIGIAGHVKQIGKIFWYLLISFKTSLLTVKMRDVNAGRNNFRLGLIMLRRGKLLDAHFRFWLATKFAKQSPLCYYYLAYICFARGKIVQSVRHLYKMTSFNSRYNYRAMLLLQKIEMTSPDVLIKMAKSR